MTYQPRTRARFSRRVLKDIIIQDSYKPCLHLLDRSLRLLMSTSPPFGLPSQPVVMYHSYVHTLTVFKLYLARKKERKKKKKMREDEE